MKRNIMVVTIMLLVIPTLFSCVKREPESLPPPQPPPSPPPSVAVETKTQQQQYLEMAKHYTELQLAEATKIKEFEREIRATLVLRGEQVPEDLHSPEAAILIDKYVKKDYWRETPFDEDTEPRYLDYENFRFRELVNFWVDAQSNMINYSQLAERYRELAELASQGK